VREPRAPAGRARGAPGPAEPTAPVPLAELPVDPEIARELRAQGIESLFPPQAAALGPLDQGRSLVLACPTASGKSLVAYLALLRAYRAGRTGLYLVPLRALAQEKFDELGQFAALGAKVGISMGDFDLATSQLEKLDLLVATSEKADGLLRHGSPWLDRLGVVVADEVHLMRDPDRGPTLEVTLTRLRRRNPDLQVVALSATVGNSEEIAEWLGAEHIRSEFRPVPLRWGVYQDGRITFTDLSTKAVAGPGDPLARLVRSVSEEGGQALVFVSTRRGSEQVAQALTGTVRGLLTPAEREAALAVEGELLATAEEETEGVRRLSELIPHGVAFHNASLTNAERRVVERAFRDRKLKALAATPTLAAGINLPARRVIVRDTTRYDDRLGMQAPIPALEIQQMLGRAGRPRYDREGEGLLLARSDEEEERFLDEYLSAPAEPIRSRLAAEPALRMHVLALIASHEVATEAELESFFADTFYGHTLPLVSIRGKVREVRRFLEENEFLVPGEQLRATPFGRLTSDLYLDPITALLLRRALERAPHGVRPFALLAAVAATPDLPPLFLRRGEERELLVRYTDEEAELLVKPEEEPLRTDFDLFLAMLKTACILEEWIQEARIIDITGRYGIGAGDLRTKVEDAEWLLFGLSRLAAQFRREFARPADALMLRVRYGIREEILDLVHLKGIGRVRGRRLYQAGFADREALAQASVEKVASALGSRSLAEATLKQVRHPSAPVEVPVVPLTRPDAEAASTPAPPARSRARKASSTGGGRTLEEYHKGEP
jgi:helicase